MPFLDNNLLRNITELFWNDMKNGKFEKKKDENSVCFALFKTKQRNHVTDFQNVLWVIHKER